MQHGTTMSMVAVCAALVLAALPLAAQEEGQEAEMSAEQQAQMEAMEQAWEEAGAVGPQHEYLADSAGSWHVTAKHWGQPGAEPEVSEGKEERKMILGGRVLMAKHSGTMMGEPFKGLSLTGYDNTTGKFWSTWTDTVSTALYLSEGTCNEDVTHCEYTMTGTDPMSGGEMSMRFVTEQMGEDAEKMTMYMQGEEGEFKTMELLYERTMTSQAAREMKEGAAEAKQKAKELKEKAETKMQDEE